MAATPLATAAAKNKVELCRLGLAFLRMAIRLKLTLSNPLIFFFPPPQAKDWGFPSGIARHPHSDGAASCATVLSDEQSLCHPARSCLRRAPPLQATYGCLEFTAHAGRCVKKAPHLLGLALEHGLAQALCWPYGNEVRVQGRL